MVGNEDRPLGCHLWRAAARLPSGSGLEPHRIARSVMGGPGKERCTERSTDASDGFTWPCWCGWGSLGSLARRLLLLACRASSPLVVYAGSFYIVAVGDTAPGRLLRATDE